MDVGGKSYLGRGECKSPKREKSRKARVFGGKENKA